MSLLLSDASNDIAKWVLLRLQLLYSLSVSAAAPFIGELTFLFDNRRGIKAGRTTFPLIVSFLAWVLQRHSIPGAGIVWNVV